MLGRSCRRFSSGFGGPSVSGGSSGSGSSGGSLGLGTEWFPVLPLLSSFGLLGILMPCGLSDDNGSIVLLYGTENVQLPIVS